MRKKSLLNYLLFLLCTAGFFATSKAQTVSTLVPFSVGDDMHYAADGHIYSSHYGGNHFRKINPSTGEVDTILMVNTNTVGAIEMDADLNIYACSYELGWLGKFREGDSGITTFVNGLSGPAGIAGDSNGNLYVATNQNHRIIRVSPNGSTEIYAQGSPLFWPTGITIDPDGNLYVANMFTGQIIKVTTSRQATTLATLPAVNDQTPDLAYLTWTNGRLFVCHYARHVIYEVDPENGDFQILAGSGTPGSTDGSTLEARFLNPTGIVANPAGDSLYVTDGANPNYRLRVIALNATSSVGETAGKNDFSLNIISNPVQEKLRLEMKSDISQYVDFQIIDKTGKIFLERKKEPVTGGLQNLEMDTSQLAGGIYFLRSSNERFQKTLKFLVI